MECNSRKLKALSLVETIVYLAIFGIVFVAVIEFALTISEYNRTNTYRQQLDRTAILLLQHLETEFSQAKSIDAANSVFNNDTGSLQIQDFSNNTVKYVSSSNQITVQRGASTPVTLIPTQELTVEKFRLTPILDTNSNYVGVHWEISLQSKGKGNITRSVESTNILP